MNEPPATTAKVLSELTPKQLETLRLLGSGHTGKEIATQLNLSESAVVQRIESIRRKFGGITRHEVARKYRDHLAREGEGNCKEITGNFFHLHGKGPFINEGCGSQSPGSVTFADSYAVEAIVPWDASRKERLVPEVLDGENAALARWVYVVMIAGGMAILLLVLLAIANSIGDLA